MLCWGPFRPRREREREGEREGGREGDMECLPGDMAAVAVARHLDLELQVVTVWAPLTADPSILAVGIRRGLTRERKLYDSSYQELW